MKIIGGGGESAVTEGADGEEARREREGFGSEEGSGEGYRR